MMSPLMQKFRQGGLLLGLLLLIPGCQTENPSLSAEEWLEVAVSYVQDHAGMASYTASNRLTISGTTIAKAAPPVKIRRLEEQGEGRERSGQFVEISSEGPEKWLDSIVGARSGVTVEQTRKKIVLEVELKPQQWKELLKNKWEEEWQAISRQQQEKSEIYYSRLSELEAGQLEAEIGNSLEEAKLYLQQIDQTLSTDGHCTLVIDPIDKTVEQLKLEIMLHYGHEDAPKEEKWLAEYNFLT